MSMPSRNEMVKLRVFYEGILADLKTHEGDILAGKKYYTKDVLDPTVRMPEAVRFHWAVVCVHKNNDPTGGYREVLKNLVKQRSPDMDFETEFANRIPFFYLLVKDAKPLENLAPYPPAESGDMLW